MPNIQVQDVRLAMAQRACERNHFFSLEVFREQLGKLLDSIEAELLGRGILSIAVREVGTAGRH